MRVDLLLVQKGLATSRTRAQELISSGRVFATIAGKKVRVRKASAVLELGPSDALNVEANPDEQEFVSRGGIKLWGAFQHTRLNLVGWSVLDIGISTGGFADCCLQKGAAAVVGVDVGHDQLSPKLRRDNRVTLFEGINARDLSVVPLLQANHGRGFDLLVVDVSFISLTMILPSALPFLGADARVLALVKPQFEVGRDGLGKNGIVRDAKLYTEVEAKIRRAVANEGLLVEDYFASSIEGSDGNKEFFVYAKSPQMALRGIVDERSNRDPREL
jgi:23S rRNA (cytidine1920-2'-O)/16S rRNA (cytidine1409-2'-O)-methyltransferase